MRIILCAEIGFVFYLHGLAVLWSDDWYGGGCAQCGPISGFRFGDVVTEEVVLDHVGRRLGHLGHREGGGFRHQVSLLQLRQQEVEI